MLVFLLVLGVGMQSISAHANEFLVGWGCCHGWVVPEQVVRTAIDSSSNVVVVGSSVDENKRALDLCLKENLEALVVDPRIVSMQKRQRDYAAVLDSVISDYGSNPALLGYYIKDGPSAREFRWLSVISNYLIEKDPRRVVFINLLPIYATREQLGRVSYEQYVDEFCRVVRPKLLSFGYRFSKLAGSRSCYLENLEVIRRQSIKHSVPFISFISLPADECGDDQFNTILLWHVGAALAYGAQGIVLVVTSEIAGRDCLEQHAGVRKIHGLMSTLARLRTVAVYYTENPPSNAKVLPEKGLISRIDGGELVVGQFDSDAGQKYAMFLNLSIDRTLRSTIYFSQKVRLWEISPLTGRLLARTVYDNVAGSIWRTSFASGQAKLMLIDTPQNLPILFWNDLPKFRPRVMLNPSCQFGNVIRGHSGEELYNEGLNMYDLALKVRDELLRDGRVDVFISRASRDQEVSLRYETELTKSLNCDVLVSLHSDATADGTPGGGTWTFYADEVEGKRLAECVQMPLLEAIRSFYPEVQFRGIRTHWYRLWVLWESGCPASLTEVLFHTHPKEREILKDSELQWIMARAIARGILNYFGLD
ncbi:MAG: N-acetylmuramoyl-L-alanine amidase family protein [Armatimonadota bacterium]